MKKKNIILLSTVAALGLSAGVLGLSKVGNFNFSAAEGETGVFTINETANNTWDELNYTEPAEIESNRGTKANLALYKWYDASFSKASGSFAHIDLGTDSSSQAWVVVKAHGLVSLSWTLNKTAIIETECYSLREGFVGGTDVVTNSSGIVTAPDWCETVTEIRLKFYATNNSVGFDVDVVSLTATYLVSNCWTTVEELG